MQFRLPAITALTAVALLTAACQDDDAEPEAEEIESGAVTQPQELNDEGSADETAMAADPAAADEPVSDATSASANDTVATGSGAQAEAETSATGAASQEATDAAVQAVQDGEDPQQAAQSTAEDAADADGTVGALADGETLATLLTMENFDLERVDAAIKSSDIGEVQKLALSAGLNKANEDPEALQRMLVQVRTALDVAPTSNP